MITKIERRIKVSKKLQKTYDNFELLLSELDKKEIPFNLQNEINQKILELNNSKEADKSLIKSIETLYSEILKEIKNELGIFTKNYHQNNWLSLGMALFGLPIGVVIYALTKNPAFIPIGLPIGMSIGIAIGIIKDNKTKNENKQIAIEKY